MDLNAETLSSHTEIVEGCKLVCGSVQLAPMNAYYEALKAMKDCSDEIAEAFPNGLAGSARIVVKYTCDGPQRDSDTGDWSCARLHSVVFLPLQEGSGEKFEASEVPRF